MQTIFEHLRYSNKEFFAKDATESTLDLQIYLLKLLVYRWQRHTRRGMIWSRLWIPEAHQERDDLVPFRLLRGTRREDDLCPRHSKRERVWSRLHPPEAHQKRDDQVSTLGSRGTPEE